MEFRYTEEAPDKLSRRVWIVWQSGAHLSLSRYLEEQRKTPRHKYRPVAQWGMPYWQTESRCLSAPGEITESVRAGIIAEIVATFRDQPIKIPHRKP